MFPLSYVTAAVCLEMEGLGKTELKEHDEVFPVRCGFPLEPVLTNSQHTVHLGHL